MPSLHQPPSPPPPPAQGTSSTYEPPPLEYRGDAPYNMPSLPQPSSPPPPRPPPPPPPPPRAPQKRTTIYTQDAPCIEHPGRIEPAAFRAMFRADPGFVARPLRRYIRPDVQHGWPSRLLPGHPSGYSF